MAGGLKLVQCAVSVPSAGLRGAGAVAVTMLRLWCLLRSLSGCWERRCGRGAKQALERRLIARSRAAATGCEPGSGGKAEMRSANCAESLWVELRPHG